MVLRSVAGQMRRAAVESWGFVQEAATFGKESCWLRARSLRIRTRAQLARDLLDAARRQSFLLAHFGQASFINRSKDIIGSFAAPVTLPDWS